MGDSWKIIPVLVGVLILGTIGISQNVFAQIEEVLVVEGRFNVLEIIYQDNSISYEYFISTQEEDKIKYTILNFEEPDSNLIEMSGKLVQVTGNPKPNSPVATSISGIGQINVVSITPLKDDKKILTEEFLVADLTPTSLNSATLLNRFFSDPNEPHTNSYFVNRFYSDPDSLAAYWSDVSYGQFSFTGFVNGWLELSGTKLDYPTSSRTAFHFAVISDVINLHDPFVDFTDVDQLLIVYNDILSCDCAFTFFSPQSVTTAEGVKEFFIIHLPDGGEGPHVGRMHENGIGSPAHEMAHNFGLNHTPPPKEDFGDNWSLMDKGDDPDGPPSVIAGQKNDLGWIPSNDILTVPRGQTKTFTLDMLSDPSPGPNYLMGIVPLPGKTHPAFTIGGGDPVCPTDFCFDPLHFNLKKDDSVVWTNNDDVPHTITSGQPSDPIFGDKFDSGILLPGQSFRHQFTELEFFPYFCTIHTSDHFIGSVQVNEGSRFYTIEARQDTLFDQTPQDQTGLVIYHHDPDGHPDTSEPLLPFSLIDTTGRSDHDNADIELGESYTSNQNKITHLAQTDNTITVEVNNNISIIEVFPSKDNTLYDGIGIAGVKSNGMGPHMYIGVNNEGDVRRAIVEFDVSNIPAGSTVTETTLKLSTFDFLGPHVVDLHKLSAPWTEGTSLCDGPTEPGIGICEGGVDNIPPGSTWTHRSSPGIPWATSGGDFSGIISASLAVSGAGTHTWGSTAEMVEDVQGWVDDINTINGWILKNTDELNNGTAARYDTREGFTPPVLVVKFTPPDSDGDGVPNAFDNCLDTQNTGQEDHDGDEIGDACDPITEITSNTLATNTTFGGDLTVDGATFTIPSEVTIDFDFANYKIIIKAPNGGILIKFGGKIT